MLKLVDLGVRMRKSTTNQSLRRTVERERENGAEAIFKEDNG